MAKLTRRGLIRQTSVGAAAIGTGIAVPGFASAHAAAASHAPREAMPGPSEPLAAYVHDPARGELALLVGSREIVVRDPELVRRLVQAAR